MTIWHSICVETIEAFETMGRYDFLLEQIKLKPKTFVPIYD